MEKSMLMLQSAFSNHKMTDPNQIKHHLELLKSILLDMPSKPIQISIDKAKALYEYLADQQAKLKQFQHLTPDQDPEVGWKLTPKNSNARLLANTMVATDRPFYDFLLSYGFEVVTPGTNCFMYATVNKKTYQKEYLTVPEDVTKPALVTSKHLPGAKQQFSAEELAELLTEYPSLGLLTNQENTDLLSKNEILQLLKSYRDNPDRVFDYLKQRGQRLEHVELVEPTPKVLFRWAGILSDYSIKWLLVDLNKQINSQLAE